MKASRIVAEHVSQHADDVRHLLHPRFVETMQHACLSGNDFIRASRNDHAPLTDLRLRRDDSSRQMLYLNLRRWRDTSPTSFNDLRSKVECAKWLDTPGLDLLRVAREPFVADSSSSTGSLQFATNQDAYEGMLKYVNAFGSWHDAEAVAVAYAQSDRQTSPRLRGLTSSLAGVVIGHSGDVAVSDELFQDAAAYLEDDLERFFTYLRWASLAAKRRRDPDRADVLLTVGLSSYPKAATSPDGMLAVGLASNLRAFLALRRGDSDESRRLLTAAIEQLRGSLASSDQLGVESPETARYVWMAELNAAQLDLAAEQDDDAIQRLHALLEFTERRDQGARHTTLSALAFVHIRRNEPVLAVSFLIEALDLLRREYDPSVVTQVRKMLYRAFVELKDEKRAERVRELSPYFWSTSAMEEFDVH
ncbi:hypothetical protein [Leifsonia xyli]|uniref:hypothetical protein n=1 Tax=Leifsonia xyli TaxID=1575 RepID=UPI003D67F959